MSDVDEIFADVEKEGTDPFEALETVTPSESQPENEPEEDEPVEGQDAPPAEEAATVPFHEHPRWKAREEELQSLREQAEENARIIAELAAAKPSSETEVPEWFQELYGDNPIAYAKYSEVEQARKEEIKREIIESQEKERIQAIEEEQRWAKFVQDGFASLEGEGKTFDRNELGKFMLENPITDIEGNFDFARSLSLFERINPPATSDPAHSNARKQLADQTTRSRASGDKPARDYMTPADLRNKSWGSL